MRKLFFAIALISFAVVVKAHTNHNIKNNSMKEKTNKELVFSQTFPVSDQVAVKKVQYKNRYGIQLVGDMYLPKGMDKTKKHPAIIVGHPFTGVKEQTAGIYAQEMAKNGFVALAFDYSYNGESGGEPRKIATPEGYLEDIYASVDFIGTRPFVDRDKIGAIGICGSGAFVLSAAAFDTRIKAIATVSMADMGAATRGYTPEDRKQTLDHVGEQRWKEFEGADAEYSKFVPDTLPKDANPVIAEYYAYYRGKDRGMHPNSDNRITLNSFQSLMNFYPFQEISTISPRPILIIAGEKAYSKPDSDRAYAAAKEPKELYIVPGATHVDLYDQMNKIPFEKIESFFTENLK
ncbi:MAG: alpha/beta hydrolase [Draconibacterium sp.]